MSSPGRNDEPMSTQVYLSTSPRKKRFRFVPFSRMISARSIRAGSLIARHPPSPEMMFLVSWKLKAARLPSAPALRPL